jgi:hypothetical protein
MVTTKRRYIHIVGALLGSLSVNTIQSISFNDDAQEIAASGDDDQADSFLAKGKRTTRGTLVIQDPVQADALMAAAQADLTYSGKPEAGGVAVNMTLKNVIFFSRSSTQMHNGVWGESLTFRCYLPSGLPAALTALAT